MIAYQDLLHNVMVINLLMLHDNRVNEREMSTTVSLVPDVDPVPNLLFNNNPRALRQRAERKCWATPADGILIVIVINFGEYHWSTGQKLSQCSKAK